MTYTIGYRENLGVRKMSGLPNLSQIQWLVAIAILSCGAIETLVDDFSNSRLTDDKRDGLIEMPRI